MKIPSRFKLHGQTIDVKFVKHLTKDENEVGRACFRDNIIRLQESIRGFERTDEMIEVTFLHELVHFILLQMGEDGRKDNEKFTHLFSSLLHQALITMEYS